MRKLVENYCELPRITRKPLWQLWHKLILFFDKNKDVTFMNYGYESLNGEPKLVLNDEDETNRYCIQLYHKVAYQIDLENKDVLEVGSGRGGGGSYIKRYLKPSKYVGIDISSSVIDFCNSKHKVEGLSFIKGEAEKQPFPNETFDALVNVESARCYPSKSRFFSEVHRVLKPNGHFLFADMIREGEVDVIHKKLDNAGFKIADETNITPNVVKALDIDHERRKALIDSFVPKFLRNAFLQFAGAKGTERYQSFATGKMEYWIYLLKKV